MGAVAHLLQQRYQQPICLSYSNLLCQSICKYYIHFLSFFLYSYELNVFCYGKYDRNREPDFSVYAFVGINNKMNNELLVFNLDYNMNEYLDLDIEKMTKLVRKTDGPFKIIKAKIDKIIMLNPETKIIVSHVDTNNNACPRSGW